MKEVKLNELVDIYLGVTHTPKYVLKGVPFLSVKNISSGKICFDDCKYISQEEYDSLSEGAKPKVGDMLFCRVGTLGKPIIIPEGTPLFGSFVSLGYLRNKDYSRCDLKYLKYWMHSNSFWKQVNSNVKGASQVNLNTGWLSKFDVNLPEIHEQEHRITILDKCKSIIKKREEELIILNNLIKARFVEMFSGKYEYDSLIKLCNFIDYRGKTPEKSDSGLPFITAKNIKMHEMSFESKEYISKENYDKVMTRGFPKEGDVLFTTEAPFGNVCRIPHMDTEYYIGQRIITMQPYNMNSVYLEFALTSEEFQEKMNRQSSGSTVKGIRSKLLEQLTIPVPPIELQNEFAEFVEQIDKSKFIIQKQLDETQKLFDKLMQDYFG